MRDVALSKNQYTYSAESWLERSSVSSKNWQSQGQGDLTETRSNKFISSRKRLEHTNSSCSLCNSTIALSLPHWMLLIWEWCVIQRQWCADISFEATMTRSFTLNKLETHRRSSCYKCIQVIQISTRQRFTNLQEVVSSRLNLTMTTSRMIWLKALPKLSTSWKTT